MNVEALADLGPIVRSHHEHWDGNGYPDHLAGDDIPWQSQILAVCDTVHAMSSERRYRCSPAGTCHPPRTHQSTRSAV